MSTTSVSNYSKDSDEFTIGMNTFFDALAKRWQLLAGLGVLLVIVAGIMAVVATQKEQKSGEGRNALYLAERSLDTQLAAIAKAQAPAAPVVETPINAKDPKAAKKAPPAVTAEAVLFKKMDVDTQLGDSVAKLKTVADEYASTRPGFEATLVLGQLYLNHGETAKAVEWFTKATQNAATTLDRALSWESLGLAQENLGKNKEALEAFEKGLSTGEATIKGDLLMAKARSYQALNDSKQAQATYEQVETLFPNTDYAKRAQLYKSLVK